MSLLSLLPDTAGQHAAFERETGRGNPRRLDEKPEGIGADANVSRFEWRRGRI